MPVRRPREGGGGGGQPPPSKTSKPTSQTTCWRIGFCGRRSDAAHTNKSPATGDGARWVHLCVLPYRARRSLPKQQAHHPNAQPHRWLHKKPRQGAGLSWSRLSDGACRRGAKPSAASRHPNAEPQSWLHTAQGETLAEKAPPSSGAKVPSEGACRLRQRQTHRDNTTVGAQRAGMT